MAARSPLPKLAGWLSAAFGIAASVASPEVAGAVQTILSAVGAGHAAAQVAAAAPHVISVIGLFGAWFSHAPHAAPEAE